MVFSALDFSHLFCVCKLDCQKASCTETITMPRNAQKGVNNISSLSHVEGTLHPSLGIKSRSKGGVSRGDRCPLGSGPWLAESAGVCLSTSLVSTVAN